jgi:hypothetical protein
MRGWGTVNTGLLMLASPKSSRSRSSVRGAFWKGRSRPAAFSMACKQANNAGAVSSVRTSTTGTSVHTRCLLAFLLFFAHLVHQILAQAVAGHAEFLPPVGQHFFDLANVGAQAHEVKGGPETRLLDQTKRAYCRHVSRNAAASPRFRACRWPACRRPTHRRYGRLEHVINGIHQRRGGNAGAAAGGAPSHHAHPPTTHRPAKSSAPPVCLRPRGGPCL